jgi:hypothetical protein
MVHPQKIKGDLIKISELFQALVTLFAGTRCTTAVDPASKYQHVPNKPLRRTRARRLREDWGGALSGSTGGSTSGSSGSTGSGSTCEAMAAVRGSATSNWACFPGPPMGYWFSWGKKDGKLLDKLSNVLRKSGH